VLVHILYIQYVLGIGAVKFEVKDDSTLILVGQLNIQLKLKFVILINKIINVFNVSSTCNHSTYC
jgi:hypothetical protein